ncbi:Uncharacterised protein [uncultured archaeon]|nr:Uncharacterised protein [uncultured archaeon]
MKHLKLTLDYHKEKTVAAFKNLGELIIFFFITIVAASIPTMFELSRVPGNFTSTNSTITASQQINMNIFVTFIFVIVVVFLSILFVFHLKYDEYKEKYLLTLTKIVLQEMLNEGESVDYDAVASKIVYLTGEDYSLVMNCLFFIIPPNRNGTLQAPS